METIYLRTFLEVVRHGSFSKAAEILFVTQSAVSRRIRFMEEQYGCQLIDRSGPLLKPTAAGAVVYENAWQMLELESSLASQLQKLKQRPSLSFACTRPFGIASLPDILKKFMNRFNGEVDIKVSFEMPPQALQGLREGRHDLIVLEHWDRIDFSPARQIPLGTDEMIFISSPQLGIPGPFATVDDLICRRLYRRREDCCSGKLLNANMTAIGRDPGEFDTILLYDDLHVIIESVRAGEGIAFISRSLVVGDIDRGELREHRVEGFSHVRSRTLAYRDDIVQNKSVRRFIDCLTEPFGITAGIEQRT
jgi:LysR family transcriptional regulator, transcriptional activator of the cysJI operon